VCAKIRDITSVLLPSASALFMIGLNRAAPSGIQSDIAVREELPEGPGLDGGELTKAAAEEAVGLLAWYFYSLLDACA
jgi:hypothetical protein